MGGQNHQPCGEYLLNSTLLSRYLSVVRCELELANIELENLIVDEISTGEECLGSVDGILAHLELSKGATEDMVISCDRLRDQMNSSSFSDLPTLHTINLEEIGIKLSSDSLVGHDSWKKISKIILDGGFYSVLSFFEESINEIQKQTVELLEVTKKLDGAASKGEVNLVLEENRTGNIRRPFANLYTKLAEFQNDFLASALLSTEVWYAYMEYGSLSEEKQESLIEASIN